MELNAHSSFSDPALARIIAAVDGVVADVKKSNAWFAERDAHIRYALKGDPDWARFDKDASINTLLAIHRALEMDAPEFKRAAQSLIAHRIQEAAHGHADVCERNGMSGQERTAA